ncbi:MAG: hypothetical protein WDW38_006166 [Sanguina aurantia]
MLARPVLCSRPSCISRVNKQSRRGVVAVRASAGEVTEVQLGKASTFKPRDSWVGVCRPEDLPKGTRKEVEVGDRQVLMFWYRNQIYCIEARSPAEGAYSEGFIKAKFTQDFAIECPATQSLFSLKDGSIVSWYPTNPVLAALTPASTCRPLEIYPVKLSQEAIYVDVTKGTLGGTKIVNLKGGAGTSLEDNNVFTVQPTVYFEGMDPTSEAASAMQVGPAQGFDPIVVGTALLALGIIGAIGTSVALYFEDLVLLAAFWVVLGSLVALSGYNYVTSRAQKDGSAPK